MSSTPGALRLKGDSAKISKPRKKKKPPQTATETATPASSKAVPVYDTAPHDAPTATTTSSSTLANTKPTDEKAKQGKAEKREKEEEEEEGGEDPHDSGKTEAELRHAERKRRRLDERLKREGTKTHKERVEELNRYLSGLSEHHDMPRIGPG